MISIFLEAFLLPPTLCMALSAYPICPVSAIKALAISIAGYRASSCESLQVYTSGACCGVARNWQLAALDGQLTTHV